MNPTAGDRLATHPAGPLELGAVWVSPLVHQSFRPRRAARSRPGVDTDCYTVALTLHQAVRVDQVDREGVLGSVDLVLLNGFRPGMVADGAGSGLIDGVAARVPKGVLALPPSQVDRLVARRLPGRTGVGALLSQFLLCLATGASQYRSSDATRLGTVLLDLLTAVLAHELDTDAARSPQNQRQSLITRILAFVQDHLADAGLSPASIAAAHHISTRYLHKLFHSQGLSVAGWIRQRRLEACRRDLSDPAQRGRSTRAIAARWGFTNPAHFSRAYRAAYGVAPSDHRRLVARTESVRGSSTAGHARPTTSRPVAGTVGVVH
ncbi:helix-turn-helix domain-containing protein [Goodfellowiella coeruleoviolacea]|uniref:helix-turn-helix domain-containing protein n=1 Tax=Goodfellowiella coeruleoviolacea TaxID=334858 RepID=UPI0020A5041D|nr:helix-turn-helix domain-containing protein [Goodfellowiella coeruleoviolacea]